jgi:hypothetical protein
LDCVVNHCRMPDRNNFTCDGSVHEPVRKRDPTTPRRSVAKNRDAKVQAPEPVRAGDRSDGIRFRSSSHAGLLPLSDTSCANLRSMYRAGRRCHELAPGCSKICHRAHQAAPARALQRPKRTPRRPMTHRCSTTRGSCVAPDRRDDAWCDDHDRKDWEASNCPAWRSGASAVTKVLGRESRP